MNFSLKSIEHCLDHLGHPHLPRKLSWSSLSDQKRAQLKTYLGKTLIAAVLALGTYQLLTRAETGIHVFAAMAGVSAFLYIGLTFDCTSRAQILLNLLAAPVIFFVAYAGLSGSGIYLTAAFVLHALVSFAQMTGRDKGRKILLYGWANFNLFLALLI